MDDTTTPAEVYRRLLAYTGPSPARAIAAYHAIVTGQEMPPEPTLEWLAQGAPPVVESSST